MTGEIPVAVDGVQAVGVTPVEGAGAEDKAAVAWIKIQVEVEWDKVCFDEFVLFFLVFLRLTLQRKC